MWCDEVRCSVHWHAYQGIAEEHEVLFYRATSYNFRAYGALQFQILQCIGNGLQVVCKTSDVRSPYRRVVC